MNASCKFCGLDIYNFNLKNGKMIYFQKRLYCFYTQKYE